MKHLMKIYAGFFLIIAVAIVYMYFSLEKMQHELAANIEKLFLSQAHSYALNIENHLKKKVKGNFHTFLLRHPKVQKELSEELSLLVTDAFRYIFVLYEDSSGDFRFLLDASKEESGEFGEKLGVDSSLWRHVCHMQTPQVIHHKNFDELWITYLYPIVVDGTTEAVVAIDFSTTFSKNLESALSPLKQGFVYIFIIIFIILLLLLYQTFLNFKTKKESITDTLTQVYNRNYLREFLKRTDIGGYQIIMLDIDHFKKVNDTYGHRIGDYILRDVAAIIQEEVRSSDVLVRYGGEEFLIFIKNDKDPKLARTIAQRIRKRIEKTTFRYDDVEIHLTVSMGITLLPKHFKNISEAIKNADEMLYIAKKEGRNRVVSKRVYDANEEVVQQNKLRINEVKNAIEERRIVCHYQPIFNAKTAKISKYEALVRLVDEEGELVYPGSFLEMILHTNLYTQMTKNILEIVFETIREKRVKIGVNLNFSDILNDDIFKMIIEELQKHKKVASWLVLELLEYEALEANESFTRKIKEIKSYGVNIAIDDFGSGFANYKIFQMMPIDVIKIDGSLIQNLDSSDVAQTIVKSIVVLTNELGIETVAEFVHSKAVMEKAKELGVTHLQGFYLAKPSAKIN